MKKLNMVLASVLVLTIACHGNSKNDTGLFSENTTQTAVAETNTFLIKKKNTIKVALLLDTSNSMDGLIHQAKAQLWEIVNELSYAKCDNEKPDLEIALYEYGNDNLPASEGHIRQVLAFSSDLDEISEKLFSLTTRGGNEFCGQVIQTSIDQLDWGTNEKDLKLLFIAGNEPFTQGKIHYKNAITNAVEKDVVVNTIFCGNYEQGISGMWKDGALLGKGDYMTIAHTKSIVHVKTPYDAQIMQYNQKLNKTYIGYGSMGIANTVRQSAQDANAVSVAEEIAVERAVSKSSALYKNSSWDLVDAVENNEVKLEDISKDKLPKNLQDKSKSEIASYVKQQSAERKEIQQKIRELNKKRTSYIAENKKDKTNASDLESAVIKAIKTQAARKNYTW